MKRLRARLLRAFRRALYLAGAAAALPVCLITAVRRGFRFAHARKQFR
jgi:hypothetical protein